MIWMFEPQKRKGEKLHKDFFDFIRDSSCILCLRGSKSALSAGEKFI